MTKKIDFEEWTPEKAAEQLKKNSTNRKPSQGTVNKYAADMSRGDWQEDDPNAISIDKDGNLLNGQHRLMAIVKSGVTLTLLTMRGASRESQYTMDTGRARSLADQIHMRLGKSNSTVLGSLAKVAITVDAGRESASQSDTTHARLLAWIEEHPNAGEAARLGDSFKNRLLMPPSAIALAAWLIHEKGGNSYALIEMYLDKLDKPVGEPEDSAVFAVTSRARRATMGNSGGSGAVKARAYASLLVKGWNYWAAGKTVVTLQMTDRDKFPPKPVKYSR